MAAVASPSGPPTSTSTSPARPGRRKKKKSMGRSPLGRPGRSKQAVTDVTDERFPRGLSPYQHNGPRGLLSPYLPAPSKEQAELEVQRWLTIAGPSLAALLLPTLLEAQSEQTTLSPFLSFLFPIPYSFVCVCV
eukprot:g10792.t1